MRRVNNTTVPTKVYIYILMSVSCSARKMPLWTCLKDGYVNLSSDDECKVCFHPNPNPKRRGGRDPNSNPNPKRRGGRDDGARKRMTGWLSRRDEEGGGDGGAGQRRIRPAGRRGSSKKQKRRDSGGGDGGAVSRSFLPAGRKKEKIRYESLQFKMRRRDASISQVIKLKEELEGANQNHQGGVIIRVLEELDKLNISFAVLQATYIDITLGAIANQWKYYCLKATQDIPGSHVTLKRGIHLCKKRQSCVRCELLALHLKFGKIFDAAAKISKIFDAAAKISGRTKKKRKRSGRRRRGLEFADMRLWAVPF